MQTDVKANQTEQVLPLRAGHGELRYLLFLPAAYPDDPAKRWPLILFLHGAGERGMNLRKVAKHGPPKIVRNQPDFPFVVVSPQCPADMLWSSDQLAVFVDALLSTYRIDPERVYLTGLSMGAYGVWKLALHFPEKFAAIAPVCGGADLLPVLLADAKWLRAIRRMGIWAFHGANDEIVPVDESKRMIEALYQAGLSARLTVYPEAAHDSWTETYDNPALYKWFLSHSRRPKRRSAAAKKKRA